MKRPMSLARPLRVPLTEAELGALVAAARGTGVTAVRNRALVALLAGSGCKLGETLALVEDDLDLDQQRLSVHTTSGELRRRARLLPAAVPHVEAWRLVRQRLESIRTSRAPERMPFFCTRGGGPLESSYVRRLLPRLAADAGLDRSVNAGLLRATFAAHVYRLGARLPEVQRLLGHGDARSTLHLVRPVLEEVPRDGDRTGRGIVFQPERWSLPGTDGTLRVHMTVRAVPDGDPETKDADGTWETTPVPAEGTTLVAPVRWREL